MTIYQHPRQTRPLEPEELRDYAAMAREAENALNRRRQTYPALVKAGKLDAAEAEADIAAWEALAVDWRWIATGWEKGEPCPYSFTHLGNFRRIAALEIALQRFFTNADRIAPKNGSTAKPLNLNPAEAQQISALLAMRWHAEFERDPRYAGGFLTLSARETAKVNQQLRAEIAQQDRKEAA